MRRLICLFQFLFLVLQYHTSSSSSSPAHHLCSRDQSYALLQFKHLFTIQSSVSLFCDRYGSIPSFPKTLSWNKTTTDCCSWDGVTCDSSTGQVIELDLSCSQLYGIIPPNSSLFSLRNLQRLNLAFNDFTLSAIPPSFGQFASLTHLNLSSSFSGSIPSEISHLSKLVSLGFYSYGRVVRLEPYTFDILLQNLTQLQKLSLVYVNISSVVPNSLMNLSSLRNIYLYHTGLLGKLPENIFHLPQLERLSLSHNPGLTGHLPKVNWSSSSSLSELYLSYTSFSGELPESLGELTQMRYLNLGGNNFDGQIPSTFSNLEQLMYIDVSSNHFSGQFPCWVANLTQLEYLDFSNNSLGGPFPSNLSGLPNLRYLYSYYNFHSGTLPSWVFNLPSLMYLSLRSNRLTGPIHEFVNKSMAYIDLSKNELYGPISPLSTNYFDVSHNNFSEGIPLGICNMSSFEILDFSHNNLGGVIPQCLGNFSSVLSVLNLGTNNFHGNIPTTFAEGNKLRNLDLNGNQLEGPVPRSLENCRHLEILNLGNNKINDTFPYWLETLPKLQVLVFPYNKFHGLVGTSTTKFPFPKLRIIDLSHNEFSGLLPTRYFKHFKAMRNLDEMVSKTYMGEQYYDDSVTVVMKGLVIELVSILTIFTTIDLSHNNFSGKIPRVIGKLKSLHLLNLSRNGLTGNIPPLLGNLSNLESLDLSSNQLSGKIPTELTRLTFLEVLNLSHNHLEGRIPQGNQFDTFENSSYEGNLALSGPPLLKTSGDNKTPQLQPPPTVHQEEDPTFASGFTWKAVLMGYGCGMVFGLVAGFLMFLIGKPNWFVRIVEVELRRKVKRSHTRGNGHGGRRN